MKDGDIVRFAKWEEADMSDSSTWSKTEKLHLGILIEHDKIMGLAHVLHEGSLLKLRSVFVEKAGKKDLERYDKNR